MASRRGEETSGAPLPAEAFIARWQGREGGQERANYALFLAELCGVLGVDRPDPAAATTEDNDYVFERAVKIPEPDGSLAHGRIDLYKRGCFVLEAKPPRPAPSPPPRSPRSSGKAAASLPRSPPSLPRSRAWASSTRPTAARPSSCGAPRDPPPRGAAPDQAGWRCCDTLSPRRPSGRSGRSPSQSNGRMRRVSATGTGTPAPRGAGKG